MFSSLDLLYIAIAIGVALMSIFISILLVYAILILRDINKASEAVKESIERVNNLIMKPLNMAQEIVRYAKPVIDVAERKFHEHQEAKEEAATKKSKKKK